MDNYEQSNIAYNRLIKNFVPAFGNMDHISASKLIGNVIRMEKKMAKTKSARSKENIQKEIYIIKSNIVFLLTK